MPPPRPRLNLSVKGPRDPPIPTNDRKATLKLAPSSVLLTPEATTPLIIAQSPHASSEDDLNGNIDTRDHIFKSFPPCAVPSREEYHDHLSLVSSDIHLDHPQASASRFDHNIGHAISHSCTTDQKVASFDEFLRESRCLCSFEWDFDQVQFLGISNLRKWCHGLNSAPVSAIDSMVIERRTNLWKIVLAQEALWAAGVPYTAWAPFTAPREPGTRIPHRKIFCTPPSSRDTARIPLQRIHISPHAIPSALADTQASCAREMLAHLNGVFGTAVAFTPDLERHFARCVPLEWDLGTAYAYLRPWWAGFASGEYAFWEMDARMGDQRVQDARLRHLALESTRKKLRDPFQTAKSPQACDRILNTDIPPRRVWDLYSNRVVPWSVVRCAAGGIPENVWAVSHSWVDVPERHSILTAVNGNQWCVPLPKDVELEQVRIELLNMGAEYIFLDVLCLRQLDNPDNDAIRREEWELDIPTLGYVYRHHRYQTTVVYFNGLGRPFDLRQQLLDSPLYWFNRAWTLQETCINWLPGGLTASRCSEWAGRDFVARMHGAQRDLGLHNLDTAAKSAAFAALLGAMCRRPGYATKKPYDRVAALAYLLPGHSPHVYLEQCDVADGDGAETMWHTLIQSLTGHERLDLLLYDLSHRNMPARADCRQASWRPTWAQVMETPPEASPRHDKYSAYDVLRKYIPGAWRSRMGNAYMRIWYWYSPYVIWGFFQRVEGCIRVLRPSSSESEEVHFDFDCEFTSLEAFDHLASGPFMLIAVADYEYWVAAKGVETIELDSGELVYEVNKIAVLHMPRPEERKRISEMELGRRDNIAYREEGFTGAPGHAHI